MNASLELAVRAWGVRSTPPWTGCMCRSDVTAYPAALEGKGARTCVRK